MLLAGHVSRQISRRQLFVLGGVGVAGSAVGGVGLVRSLASSPPSSSSGIDPVVGAPLGSPETVASTGGVLTTRLEAGSTTHLVAGRQVSSLSYNGGLPGPTLRVRPGDRLDVTLANTLDTPTNLHVHGLHVSPEGNSDNVFRTVEAGSTFDYSYQLPADHPPGVYWYHPHHHGNNAQQVFGGLYGAIVVEDTADSAVDSSQDQVLVVSDTTVSAGASGVPSVVLDASGREVMLGREGDLVLVNGQLRPTITARPGERLRWRVVNACSSRYLQLALDGQQLQLLGLDSGRTAAPRDVTQVLLAPGNRADLLVTTTAGRSELRARQHDRGSMMGGSTTSAAVTLATLEVRGSGVAPGLAVPAQPVPADLRGRPVAARRTLTFAMGMGGGGMGGGGMSATIDGKVYDPGRVDQSPRSGTVEEWTLRNVSGLNHPVHLHVWPMQVVESGGSGVDGVVVQDVVDVPAGSSVRVLIAFTGLVGRTVYHCHILDHEDSGMMGVVEVR